MSASDRSRINYRTDTDLKERLLEYAEAQGQSVNEILDAWVRDHLDAAETQEPNDKDARNLENKLREVEKRIIELEDEKNMDARSLAGHFARKIYANLNENWNDIRFQALEDLRSDQTPDWATKLKIAPNKVEVAIIEVCRLGMDLKEARARREDLKQRLNVVYKALSRRIPLATVNLEEQEVKN